MKAFSKLPKEWELILFGSFESENYKQALHSLAVELGISERVKFLGRISDNEVERIFMESKLCVLGTEKEVWGLVAMEAQSYGCPVVAFNVPGIRDSVLNRKTGILERFGDVDAMAASMKELIDNELIYKEMSRLAMERASLYSWDQCYVEFIKQLAAVSKSIKGMEKDMVFREA